MFAHDPLVVLHLLLELHRVPIELLGLPPLLPELPLRLRECCLQLPAAMPQLLELEGGLEALLLQLVGRAEGHGGEELEGAVAGGAREGGGARVGTRGEAALFQVRPGTDSG